MSNPPPIAASTAHAPEYDAPPPAVPGVKTPMSYFWPQRPADQVVDNPSERPAVVVRG